jgi:hypothetical protein
MESIRTDKQVKTHRVDLEDGRVIVANLRYDDSCKNGHNSFAITCDVYEPRAQRGEPSLVNDHTGKRVWLSSCGCQHDLIREHFPALADVIKWHLTSADGPMHYVANTVYWAEQAAPPGPKHYEPEELCNVCQVAEHDACAGNPVCPCCRDTMARPIREARPGSPDPATALEYARRTAVWPDATVDQLLDEKALAARLPILLEAFARDMVSLGFVF